MNYCSFFDGILTNMWICINMSSNSSSNQLHLTKDIVAELGQKTLSELLLLVTIFLQQFKKVIMYLRSETFRLSQNFWYLVSVQFPKWYNAEFIIA